MTGANSAIGGMLVIGAIALYWGAAVNARDRARAHARAFCKRQGWQLLDQTVTLRSLWPIRTARGLQWRRHYRFDFSPDGGNRRSGDLVMAGTVLLEISAEREDGGRLIE